jgi:alpha-tubulin suppressor-like RCC1 family protein
MGRNQYGQLGNGTTNNASLPVQVANDVVAAAGGNGHSLFVKADGTLWAMGQNDYGQLGNGTTGGSTNWPLLVTSNVVAAAGGNTHSLFVKTDGTLWAMGQNNYGQLGNGTSGGSANLPVQVAGGLLTAGLAKEPMATHSLALAGILPAVSLSSRTVAVGQTANFTAAVTGDGPFTYQWQLNGANIMDATNASYTISGATLSDAGAYAVVVAGTCGTTTSVAATLTVNRITPSVTTWPTASDLTFGQTLAASTLSGGTCSVAGAFAFTAPGTVPAVGAALQGVTFTPIDTNSYNSVTGSVSVTVVAPPAITDQPVGAVVSVGQETSLSVTGSGSAPLGYQWIKDGILLPGQTNSLLSFSSFKFVDSGSYSVVITNALGMTISVPASLSVSNAPLRAWGNNGDGELGAGTMDNSSLPVQVASNVVVAAAGQSHSLFVKTGGTLWAMGANGSGQLGNGTAGGSITLPIQVANNVVAAAAGQSHSLFVKADGTLWAMGYNNNGQLGIGTTGGSTNRPVQVASNVVAAAAGYYHSLFVKADGTLWAMGWNSNGRLGNGTTTTANRPVQVASNVVAVASGNDHSLFVKADGSLWAMGANNLGQLGIGTTDDNTRPVQVTNNVAATAAGYAHTLIVKADGTLWGMGNSANGELGNGTAAEANRPVLVTSNVVAAAGGTFHSLFVKADGSLWAMGQNDAGQLGDGTWTAPSQPVLVNGGGLIAASIAKGSSASHSLAIAGVLPVVSVSNRTVKVGETVSFIASVTGDGPFTYQWQLNGTNLIDATNASYSVASAALADAGTYTANVSSFVGSASQSASLTVNPALATLRIISPYGISTPTAGLYTNAIGTVLTNSMANPEPMGGTQYVCTGWSMTGSEPASGTTTQCVMSVTNHAVLTWLWTTQYQLTTAAGPNGSVTVGSGWQPMGVTTQLTAVASPYYHFATWSGDASGTSNPLELLMDAPKSVTANFAANVTTTHATPEAWLAQHGITANFDQRSLDDADRDGMVNWQEYIAGTDPTNAASRLVFTTVGPVRGTNYTEIIQGASTQRVYEAGYRVTWPGVTGRVYTLEYSTNLLNWLDLEGATDLPGHSPATTFTDKLPSNVKFYRVKVRLPGNQ